MRLSAQRQFPAPLLFVHSRWRFLPDGRWVGDYAIVDTTTAHGKLVFGMFALMAEYEAALIKERTIVGLTAARARGRTGGRKPKMTPALTNKAQRMYDSRQFTMAEIATFCGVTPMTIYRNVRTDRATAPEPSSQG